MAKILSNLLSVSLVHNTSVLCYLFIYVTKYLVTVPYPCSFIWL